MRKNKKSEDSGGGSNWMDTYGDMVTLLLTFFVMLYSMSSLDADKWQLFVQAITSNGSKQNQVVIVPPTPSDLIPGDGLVNPFGNDVALSDAGKPSDISFRLDKSDLSLPPVYLPDDIALDANAQSNSEVTTVGGDIPRDKSQVIDFDSLYEYIQNYIAENNLESDIELVKGDEYTFLTFRNNIFFDGDSSVLREEGKVVLGVLSEALKNIPDEIGEIKIYGHTARAGGADQVNNPAKDRRLSGERATNVLLYIQEKSSLSPKKIVPEAWGENFPLVPHDGTEESRIKNRRVEIYISKTTATSTTLEEIYTNMDETKSAEAKIDDTKPVETEPVETEPVETEPVETEPVEAKTAETKADNTKTAETNIKE